MTISTHNLGMSYLDDTQFPAMLKLKEGYELLPYADSKGIATIGVGVNLKVSSYMALVLDQLGVFSSYIGQVNTGRVTAGLPPLTAAESNSIYKNIVAEFESVVSSFPIVHDKVAGTGNSTSEKALQAALNLKLQSYLNGSSQTFSLLETQAKAINNEIILGYSVGPFVDEGKQARLDVILHNTLAHDSKEYMAVMSLYFNGENLVSKGGFLATAIINGNRADAWYGIRYRLNANGDHASRRYSEAAEFGLYDNAAAPTLDESKQTYQMFTAHRDNILGYENQYPPTGTGTTIKDQLGLACVTIMGDLAGNTNTDIANAWQTWVDAGNDPSNFDPTKLFLGTPGRGTAVDATQYSVPGVMGVEVASNDIVLAGDGGVFGTTGYMLVGGMGDDLLIGGSGADVLYGGPGNDVMAGGAGNDTYILDGGGHDTIEDKQGTNRVILNGKVLFNFSTTDGTNYLSVDGAFTGIMQNGDFIVTDTTTGDQVTLNQDFQSGDFGITLSNAPAATQYANTITGDILPVDTAAKAGIQAAGDAQGNPQGIPLTPFEDILYGSSGNDHIMSGDLTDLVTGNGGTDWIEGGNGNDYLIGDGTLEGDAGSDILYGGNGNDQFYGDAKIDVATAIDNGNTDSATNLRGDWLSSGSGNDTLVTGAGNDVLAGGGGNDLIIAGAGDDIIFGDASYTAALLMPGGTPRYSIGSADFYSVSPDTFNWGYTYTNNHLAFTTQYVGEANPADSGNDVIYAGAGADKVWAGAGDVANDFDWRMKA